MPTEDPAAYGEAWAGAYDRLFGTRDDSEVMVAALQRLTAGRDVLDFGIGTGRLAFPLQQAGFRVAGIEASPAMVEALRAKANTASIEVHLGDFVTTRIDRRFDVVLVAFSTLFLLSDQAEQLLCVENAAAHLRPGGIVVIEAFVPDHTRWDRGRRLALADWAEDALELEAARHDRARQRIEVRYVTIGAQGVSQRPLVLRYAWPSEIDLMARAAHLSLDGRYADWGGSPYDATSDYHVSVYRLVGSSDSEG